MSTWLSIDKTARAYIVRHARTRYAYCSIGKSGCTFHIGLIHRLFGSHTYEDKHSVHDGPTNRKHLAQRMDRDELKDVLMDVNFPKYVVVRNPVSRLLSAYRNKVEAPSKERKRIGVAAFHTWVKEEFPNGFAFNETSLAGMNVHWMPQYAHCGMQHANFFRVFKFERPGGYIDFMYRFVPRDLLDSGWGGARNVSFREFSYGPRERSGMVEDNFVRYYGRLDVFERVVSVYARDIDMFGYQSEIDDMRRRIVSHVTSRS